LNVGIHVARSSRLKLVRSSVDRSGSHLAWQKELALVLKVLFNLLRELHALVLVEYRLFMLDNVGHVVVLHEPCELHTWIEPSLYPSSS
jgi:hypothetical protein